MYDRSKNQYVIDVILEKNVLYEFGWAFLNCGLLPEYEKELFDNKASQITKH